MVADENDGSCTLLDRRSYLKAAGITTLSGLATTGSATPRGDAVVVDGTASYTVEATGRIAAVTRTGNRADTVDSGTVTGTVDDGVAIYRVSGRLVTADVDGAATLRYDVESAGPTTEVVVTSPTAVTYEMTTTGVIRHVTNGGAAPDDEWQTTITHDDGTWTASGHTGHGRVDRFVVSGDVTSFSPRNGDFSVLRDGSPVSPTELDRGVAADTDRDAK